MIGLVNGNLFLHGFLKGGGGLSPSPPQQCDVEERKAEWQGRAMDFNALLKMVSDTDSVTVELMERLQSELDWITPEAAAAYLRKRRSLNWESVCEILNADREAAHYFRLWVLYVQQGTEIGRPGANPDDFSFDPAAIP